MEIIITNPIELVVVKEVKQSVNKITIISIVDIPSMKSVKATTLELGAIDLWDKDEYDNIGQWTDQDVITRIKSLYNIV